MKLTTLLASSSLLAFAACSGGGSEPIAEDATFTGASDAELARAFTAASGVDYGLAFFLGSALASAPADPAACPRISLDGDTRTITGGCTAEDGTRFEGRATLRNVPAIFGDGSDFDPTKPQVVEYEGFSIEDADGPLELDGSVALDAANETVTTDLEVTVGGLWAHTMLNLHCSWDGPCTAEEGSAIDVAELGGATVSGTWRFESQDEQGNTIPPSGSITLRGAETLTFDVAGNADGCVPYAIDGGASGTVCDTL